MKANATILTKLKEQDKTKQNKKKSSTHFSSKPVLLDKKERKKKKKAHRNNRPSNIALGWIDFFSYQCSQPSKRVSKIESRANVYIYSHHSEGEESGNAFEIPDNRAKVKYTLRVDAGVEWNILYYIVRSKYLFTTCGYILRRWFWFDVIESSALIDDLFHTKENLLHVK